MSLGQALHGLHEHLVNLGLRAEVSLHVSSDLTVELRHVRSVHGQTGWSSESSKVDHHSESVSLEGFQEILRKQTGNQLLLSTNVVVLRSSLLQVAAVNLVILARACFFKSLSLHELSFLKLQESDLVSA